MAAPTQTKHEVPAWVHTTPEEDRYVLLIQRYDDFGNLSPQTIEVMRDEFIALKAHLAKLRGYRSGN